MSFQHFKGSTNMSQIIRFDPDGYFINNQVAKGLTLKK